MKCPRCLVENLADPRFCEGCGARLEAPCPACAEPNRLDAKFCRKCGQALAEAGAASPGAYTPKHLAEKILTARTALQGEEDTRYNS